MVLLQLQKPPASGASCCTAESPTNLTIPQKERLRALVVPREHGAWGMLLVPLVTGAVVGLAVGGRVVSVLLLTTAVLTLFWLRTPVESWLGISAVRVQTSQERQLVRNVALPLAAIAAVALTALFWRGGNHELIWVGMIAGAGFAVQVVRRKWDGRRGWRRR
jgi:predicted lysophospholipase L1 biosynthesis ABC-type transport system permease subunit